MSAVFVKRELDYFGEKGVEAGYVQLFAPRADRGDWRCDYEMSWPGYAYKSYVKGVDPWQAIRLAMSIVPTMITTSDDFKADRLGMWGKKFASEQRAYQLFDVNLDEGRPQ